MTRRFYRVLFYLSFWLVSTTTATDSNIVIDLPRPSNVGEVSLEQALSERRSVRSYTPDSISLDEVSQLLWACQGVSAVSTKSGTAVSLRTAPSAGALYPLSLYLIAERIPGVQPGIYRYEQGGQPGEHQLVLVRKMPQPNAELARSMLGQECVKQAAVNILICGDVSRMEIIYSERSERYMWIETGHAAQNVCLQATALGLGTVTVGAFVDDVVKKFLAVDQTPLYNIAVGRK